MLRVANPAVTLGVGEHAVRLVEVGDRSGLAELADALRNMMDAEC